MSKEINTIPEEDVVERAAQAAYFAYCGVENGSEPDYDDDGDWKERRGWAEDEWRKDQLCTHIGCEAFRGCARAALSAASPLPDMTGELERVLIEQALDALEECETFAKRGDPLRTGFVHGDRTRKDMADDLNSIASIAYEARAALLAARGAA